MSAAAPVGAVVLDAVREALTRYVVLPSAEAVDAVVLWVAATHAVDRFEHATRLAIHSPEKRCGKSRLLEVVESLAHEPMPTTNASVAALFRVVGSAGDRPPTLIIDEADRLFGTKKADDDNRELIGLLNNGFRPGKPTWRCVGPQQVATAFPNFAFAALAGIGRLPDTIEDRAVNITMRRRLPGEVVAKFRLRTDLPAMRGLCSSIAEWVATVGEELEAPVVSVPDELEDRAQDAWEPLLAMADAAGGEWPQRARLAAVALTREQADDDTERSTRLTLLGDVRKVFIEDGGEFVSSTDLLAALRAMSESPWGDYDLTTRRLAKYMSEWKVRPDRNKSGTARGYRLADLRDPFARYLPSEPSNRQETHPDLQERSDGTSDALTDVPSEGSGPVSASVQVAAVSDATDVSDAPTATQCTTCREPLSEVDTGYTTHASCEVLA